MNFDEALKNLKNDAVLVNNGYVSLVNQAIDTIEKANEEITTLDKRVKYLKQRFERSEYNDLCMVCQNSIMEDAESKELECCGLEGGKVKPMQSCEKFEFDYKLNWLLENAKENIKYEEERLLKMKNCKAIKGIEDDINYEEVETVF